VLSGDLVHTAFNRIGRLRDLATASIASATSKHIGLVFAALAAGLGEIAALAQPVGEHLANQARQ
jgi:hypothetical protein